VTMFQKLLNLFRRNPPPNPPGQLVQVGGRLLDSNQWAPEVIEALRKEYLMPPLKDAFLMRVSLTAGCPEGHSTTHRIGIFCDKGDFVRKVSDQMQRMRLIIPCSTCSKPARVTGRHVAWQGDLGVWDGAT